MTSPKSKLDNIQEGTQAPDFELPAFTKCSGETKISLKGYKGKKNVVLAFYPKDMTPGCTREMSAFSDQLDIFDLKDTVVLGISADSIESHRKFSETYELELTLVSDDNLEAITKYGVNKDGAPRAERVLFVIDKEGVVKHIQKGMPDYQTLLYEIEQL
ncbi:redoxin domain-containing protein [bacterium]|nr:redoxin domain-containing protein [bacterium]